MTEMDSMETLRREKLYLRESIGNRGPRARGADRARVKTLFSHQPLTRQRNLSNLSCHISAYPMGPLNFLFFLLPGEGEKRTRKGPRAAGRAECFPVKEGKHLFTAHSQYLPSVPRWDEVENLPE